MVQLEWCSDVRIYRFAPINSLMYSFWTNTGFNNRDSIFFFIFFKKYIIVKHVHTKMSKTQFSIKKTEFTLGTWSQALNV